MYLNFSNFRGRTSAGGGGDKPWSKNGDKCWIGGGIDTIFAGWGDPQSPRKNPGRHIFLMRKPHLRKKTYTVYQVMIQTFIGRSHKYFELPAFTIVYQSDWTFHDYDNWVSVSQDVAAEVLEHLSLTFWFWNLSTVNLRGYNWMHLAHRS